MNETRIWVLFLIFRRTLLNLVLLTPYDDLLSFFAIDTLNHFRFTWYT